MLAINYRNRTAQQNSKNDFIRQLNQRTRLENFYKVAQHAAKLRYLDANDSSGIRRPAINKENLTDQDIEIDLRSKLAQYMVNNRELAAFIEVLKMAGALRNFDDIFELFKSKYLVGVQRLTNLGIQALYASFVNRYLT